MTTEQHIEIYKRYRPRVWEDLVGQEKVSKSLKATVKANRLPTAFGFFGPRGCGKTSAALLLAKSINCLNPTEDGNPCNECDVCVAIDEGRQLGVNYISMANKGSVDDIRTLVQQARLQQPVKRQVWILDEVHAISKAAFESLLIPLEEKGMPSLFIFCSTEIDRIPQTILSRIQSRKFSLVDAETMLEVVKKIGQQEGLTLSDEAYNDAVRAGRGSVRDTLTALEGIVETGEYVESYSGQLLEALASRNLSETLGVLAMANQKGEDFRDLTETLFEDLRDLLLLANNVDSSLVGIVPVKDTNAAVRGLFGKRGIVLVLDEIGEAITQMTLGADARIHLEIGIIKAFTKLRQLAKALESRG